ncbi:MAG: DsbA family protein [Candidatus Levybacteria bacterium]|nr:DsbA family protein [Candidatus Levybacteria bacterium]
MNPPEPKNSYTPVLIVLLIVAAFFLGSLITKVQYLEKTSGAAAPAIAGTQTQLTQEQAAPAPLAKVDVAVGHLPILGNKNAKVTLIEFSDLQCPFCKRFFDDALAQIKKEYIDTGKVKFAYRHYPLPFHQNAQKAAEASECANEQNAFWEYHDMLFQKQTEWETQSATDAAASFGNYAQNLGLNNTQFESCLSTGKFANVVKEDTDAGQKAGVTGTPTLFVNGKAIVGAQPFASFKTVIDEELK